MGLECLLFTLYLLFSIEELHFVMPKYQYEQPLLKIGCWPEVRRGSTLKSSRGLEFTRV